MKCRLAVKIKNNIGLRYDIVQRLLIILYDDSATNDDIDRKIQRWENKIDREAMVSDFLLKDAPLPIAKDAF